MESLSSAVQSEMEEPLEDVELENLDASEEEWVAWVHKCSGFDEYNWRVVRRKLRRSRERWEFLVMQR